VILAFGSGSQYEGVGGIERRGCRHSAPPCPANSSNWSTKPRSVEQYDAVDAGIVS